MSLAKLLYRMRERVLEMDSDVIARAVAARRADVDARYKNRTALALAASWGALSLVDALLAAGASVDSSGGNTAASPLFLAASNGHLDVVRMLINAGANVHLLNSRNKSALQVAAQHRHFGVVRLLCDVVGRAAVDATDAVWFAADTGNVELLQYLIASGASVNRPNAAACNSCPLVAATQQPFACC